MSVLWKQMFDLIREGNLLQICLYLERGVSVSTRLKNKEGNTALIEAIKQGFFEAVYAMVGKDTDVNVANNAGITPLHLAVESKDIGLINVLVGARANPLAKDDKKNTPLAYAIKLRMYDAVRLFLDLGTDPNAVCEGDEVTALEVAVGCSDSEMVEMLFAYGATFNASVRLRDSLISAACARGNIKFIQHVLDNGCDINAPYTTFNETPLMLAVMCQHRGLVQYLLSRGASPNAVRSCGKSLLYLATTGDDALIVHLLLKAGVTIDPSSHSDWEWDIAARAIDKCSENSAYIIVEELLKRGCNPNAPVQHNEMSYNIMCKAMRGRRYRVINLLLDYGYDLTVVCANGKNAVSFCFEVEEGHACLEIFLKRGADPNALFLPHVANAHHTLLDWAVGNYSRNPRYAKLLVEYGADIHKNGHNSQGTMLMKAIRCNDVELLHAMIEKGADVFATSDQGKTALDYALENFDADPDVVEYLYEQMQKGRS